MPDDFSGLATEVRMSSYEAYKLGQPFNWSLRDGWAPFRARAVHPSGGFIGYASLLRWCGGPWGY